jgi:uncharacterized protein (DUF952 family)
MLIYKILRPAEWAGFEAAGLFAGSPDDDSSGFIHCSSREQAAGSAVRFFGREPGLVIAALDTRLLGDSVRWEEASSGGRFPHVYGDLPLSAVVAVYRAAGASSLDEALGPARPA